MHFYIQLALHRFFFLPSLFLGGGASLEPFGANMAAHSLDE